MNTTLLRTLILLSLALACKLADAETQADVASSAPDNTTSGSPMNMMMREPGFHLYGWVETGITGNFDSPNDRQNFGRLFDDRSNEPLLNQFILTAERIPDPKAGFDWGFKGQFLYGSDARYLHSTGLLDLTTNDTVQPDITEAWVLTHFPITNTANGLDLKLGKYGTSIGEEMTDPSMNAFYSHSYIFNFGAPFNATGLLATLYAQTWLDVSAGLTRGVNVTFDDPNDSVSFYGGAVVRCCKDKLCCAAMVHAGPENPNDNHNYRYLSDFTLTWKPNDRFTAIIDVNYAYEEAFDARGYGVAQYFTYALNDCCSIGTRLEVWRDEEGFFVAQFASNNDFIHFERGDDTAFDPRTVGGGRTTYGAVTVGLTIKPHVPKPLTGLIIRPGLRYDSSLNNTHPFNDSQDSHMLTAGVDAIISF